MFFGESHSKDALAIAFKPLPDAFPWQEKMIWPEQQVNLTDFPELGTFHLRRSLSVAGLDASDLSKTASNEANSVVSSASTAVIYASGAAEAAVSQATASKVQSFSDEISSHFPGFYSVGLWGYCEGQKGTVSYSNCSQPSSSFSFDLLGVFGSISPTIEEMLPDENNKVLAGYHDVSRWSISAYVLGIASTFLAVVFGVTTIFFSWGKPLLIISSLAATIFITGASISVTVIYGLITSAVKSIGADASLGAHSFTATWLAVAFSFAAFLTWLIEAFCCCI
ncbi:Actin cortical patch SUR7/pH-response regulator PalI [Penicillium brevicompactum]